MLIFANKLLAHLHCENRSGNSAATEAKHTGDTQDKYFLKAFESLRLFGVCLFELPVGWKRQTPGQLQQQSGPRWTGSPAGPGSRGCSLPAWCLTWTHSKKTMKTQSWSFHFHILMQFRVCRVKAQVDHYCKCAPILTWSHCTMVISKKKEKRTEHLLVCAVSITGASGKQRCLYRLKGTKHKKKSKHFSAELIYKLGIH